MIIAIAPFVVALVGLVVWYAASLPPRDPAKPHPMRAWWAEFGRIVFFVGLLVLVASLVNVAWRFTLG